jgi:hypothetical protein
VKPHGWLVKRKVVKKSCKEKKNVTTQLLDEAAKLKQ